MYQLTVNGGWWHYIAPLRKREAFRTYGSLRGEPGHGALTTGMLPDSFRASAGRADYVVYSYETPIAWHLPADVHEAPAGAKVYADGWIVPDVRYSVTTTKQSGRVVTALSVLWDTTYDRYAD